jgi:hypothetical protein
MKKYLKHFNRMTVAAAVWSALFTLSLLGMVPDAFAQTGAAGSGPIATILCYIIDNMKMAMVFAVLVGALVAWIGTMFDSEKATQLAISFAVGLVVIFAIIWGIKSLGWASALSCVASF